MGTFIVQVDVDGEKKDLVINKPSRKHQKDWRKLALGLKPTSTEEDIGQFYDYRDGLVTELTSDKAVDLEILDAEDYEKIIDGIEERMRLLPEFLKKLSGQRLTGVGVQQQTTR